MSPLQLNLNFDQSDFIILTQDLPPKPSSPPPPTQRLLLSSSVILNSPNLKCHVTLLQYKQTWFHLRYTDGILLSKSQVMNVPIVRDVRVFKVRPFKPRRPVKWESLRPNTTMQSKWVTLVSLVPKSQSGYPVGPNIRSHSYPIPVTQTYQLSIFCSLVRLPLLISNSFNSVASSSDPSQI